MARNAASFANLIAHELPVSIRKYPSTFYSGNPVGSRTGPVPTSPFSFSGQHFGKSSISWPSDNLFFPPPPPSKTGNFRERLAKEWLEETN
jgi:hypothetical protein